jgi:hypothetical protein
VCKKVYGGFLRRFVRFHDSTNDPDPSLYWAEKLVACHMLR